MSRIHPFHSITHALFGLALLFVAASAQARHGEPPYSLVHPAKAGVDVPIEEVGRIDAAQARRDADHIADPSLARSKAQKSARAIAVSITPDAQGRWDTLDDGSRLWRMRIRVAGATDIRVGFARLDLPRGATLHLIGADGVYQGPYGRADAAGGRFSSPVVPGDSATIEVRVPARAPFGAAHLAIERVGAGFRDLYKREVTLQAGESGACNINVACPLGQAYPDEIRAVGHYEFQAADDGDFYICTGTLLSDVPRDKRNWFLTAHHCISAASEAQSIVVYWNYQSTQCGTNAAPSQGYYGDDQHGGTLRATRADVDFTLLELAGTPATDWDLHYAGWDAGGAAPSGTIGIHHPSGDVKKITAGPNATTMNNCIVSTPSTGTHWHTGPYTQGTTEGGSSGSALFGAATSSAGAHRVIGTLSGGSALCSDTSPTQPNDGYDCYGKLSVAWNGASSAARLRDWLDPAGTGTTSIDGIDQNETPPSTGNGHSARAIPPAVLQVPRPVPSSSRLRPAH